MEKERMGQASGCLVGEIPDHVTVVDLHGALTDPERSSSLAYWTARVLWEGSHPVSLSPVPFRDRRFEPDPCPNYDEDFYLRIASRRDHGTGLLEDGTTFAWVTAYVRRSGQSRRLWIPAILDSNGKPVAKSPWGWDLASLSESVRRYLERGPSSRGESLVLRASAQAAVHALLLRSMCDLLAQGDQPSIRLDIRRNTSWLIAFRTQRLMTENEARHSLHLESEGLRRTAVGPVHDPDFDPEPACGSTRRGRSALVFAGGDASLTLCPPFSCNPNAALLDLHSRLGLRVPSILHREPVVICHPHCPTLSGTGSTTTAHELAP